MTSEVCLIKVLLIGEHGIGKTSLAKTVTDGAFPSAGILSETTATKVSQEGAVNGQCLEFRCNKDTTITAGYDRYVIHIFDPDDEKTMIEYLPLADICYLCFDITNPATSDSLKEKWLSFLKLKRKIILVGLKSDLAYDKATRHHLESQGLHAITQEAGRCLAHVCKASHYVEVSALKYLGIEELKDKTVFDFVEHDNAHRVAKGRARCALM